MKTKNLVINEATATITVVNINKLTKAEWNLVNMFQGMGYTLRNKRKAGKNSAHKRAYYEKKLANLPNEMATFSKIEETMSFATACKWYRAKFENKDLATVKAVIDEVTAKEAINLAFENTLQEVA